jgi:hypothetical protein
LKPFDLNPSFRMEADPETLTVIAIDDDNDPLHIYWDVPHAVPHEVNTFEDGDLTVSVLTISREAALDGARIECLITDLLDIQLVNWNMEIGP